VQDPVKGGACARIIMLFPPRIRNMPSEKQQQIHPQTSHARLNQSKSATVLAQAA